MVPKPNRIPGELRHWNGRHQILRLSMVTGEHHYRQYIVGLTTIAYLVPLRISFHKTRQRTASPKKIANDLSQTNKAVAKV